MGPALFLQRPGPPSLLVLSCLWTALLSFLSVEGLAQSQPFTPDRSDSLLGNERLQARRYEVLHYRLKVRVDPARRYLQGENTMLFTPQRDLERVRLDLHPHFEVSELRLLGAETGRWQREGRFLYFTGEQPLQAGQRYRLRVAYHGRPPVAEKPPWQGGFVWETDSLGRPWLGVACQGIGASTWWPCRDHPSDEPDSVDLIYEVPASLTAVGNGRLVDRYSIPGAGPDSVAYRGFHWKVVNPINHYNITFNAGHYALRRDRYRYPNGDTLALRYWMLDYHAARAARYFARETPRMLEAFHYWFGPYPFLEDGFQLVETPYWGMEHQSAVAYGNNFYRNRWGFDFILVHEAAHEYWGNNISAPDRGQLWMHESFATYAEALYLEYHHGYDTALAYLKQQRQRIENQARMFGPQNVAFHAWPDNDIYYKGAWVLHSFRHLIDGKRSGYWRRYFRRLQEGFAGQVVDSRTLLAAFGPDALPGLFKPQTRHHPPGPSLESLSTGWFWRAYLYHPELPVLEWRVDTSHPPGPQLLYRWRHPSDTFWMPMHVRFAEPELNQGIESIWLNPQTGRWQSIPLGKGVRASHIRWPEDQYLVRFRQVSRIENFR